MATKNDIDTNYPIEVAAGGTGNNTFTSYAVVCGGTTNTNPLQSIAGVGTAGQALTSNGAAALPTFQNIASGNPALVLISSQTAANSASLTFNAGITNAFYNFYLVFENLIPTNAADTINLTVSTDGGATFINTGYYSGINWMGPTGGEANVNVTNGAYWQLSPTLSNANGLNMALWLCNMTTGGTVQIIGDSQFFLSALPTTVIFSVVAGYNTGALTVNAIRLVASTGTLASGKVYLYSLRK